MWCFFLLSQYCSLVIIFFSLMLCPSQSSFLSQPIYVERIMPTENTFGTPSLQQRDAIEHAHIPQQSASCDCFSQYPKCPSVCLSSSSLPCSYGYYSSEIFPFFHFLSLLLNKRAVVVRSVWSTVDSSRQLMH